MTTPPTPDTTTAVRPSPTPGPDPDDLARCVRCGLCLPHCPTFRVTGDEVESPRGRIEALRLHAAGLVASDRALARALETCVQCLACEDACPSAVPYHRIITAARAALSRTGITARPPGRRLLDTAVQHLVRHPRFLRAVSLPPSVTGTRIPRWARRGVPVPDPADVTTRLPRAVRPGDRPDLLLLAGCVTHAWGRRIQRDAWRVLTATGARVALSAPGCCGALARHAGRPTLADRLAATWWAGLDRLAPGIPVVSTSAGCTLELARHPAGRPTGATGLPRVTDVTTWLAARLAEGMVPAWRPTGSSVVLHDPCHLRASGTAGRVADVLAGAYRVLRPPVPPSCCGAGGTYGALEPERAGAIRDAAVCLLAAGAPSDGPLRVASANPGCVWHLRDAGLDVRHPVTWLAAALGTGAASRRGDGARRG